MRSFLSQNHCLWLTVLLLAVLLPGAPGRAGQQANEPVATASTEVSEVLSGAPSLIDSVFGLRLALLPLADVSQSGNGISLEVTHDLAAALRDRGIDLVPEGEVMQFMADNRIRFAGYLDSLLARKLGREFDCGLIMLGTVTEFEREREPALGLTLTVMDAKSGSPVWAAHTPKQRQPVVRPNGTILMNSDTTNFEIFDAQSGDLQGTVFGNWIGSIVPGDAQSNSFAVESSRF